MLSFSTPRSGQSQNLIKRKPKFYLLKYWKTNSTLLMICQSGFILNMIHSMITSTDWKVKTTLQDPLPQDSKFFSNSKA